LVFNPPRERYAQRHCRSSRIQRQYQPRNIGKPAARSPTSR